TLCSARLSVHDLCSIFEPRFEQGSPNGAGFESPGRARRSLGIRVNQCTKPQRGEIPMLRICDRPVSPRWGFCLYFRTIPRAGRPGLSNLAPFGAVRLVKTAEKFP